MAGGIDGELVAIVVVVTLVWWRELYYHYLT
jgi:hypothetical protein